MDADAMRAHFGGGGGGGRGKSHLVSPFVHAVAWMYWNPWKMIRRGFFLISVPPHTTTTNVLFKIKPTLNLKTCQGKLPTACSLWQSCTSSQSCLFSESRHH
jgi:hypothetical protein